MRPVRQSLLPLPNVTIRAHAEGMAGQRETSTTSARHADRSDEERLIDDTVVELDPELPLDAPIETPIVDALDQRRVEPLDDDEHDMS